MIDNYFKAIGDLLSTIKDQESGKMMQVAEKIAKSIEAGGVVHFFGAGHSHILCEEVFYRAGGLVPVNPIFDANLMLHHGALRSSRLERMNGYADTFMETCDIRIGEVVFVMSTSGRNGVPVDVALLAKGKRAFVVGITSMEYTMSETSRHSSGKRLFEVVDIYIDNYCPEGDALLSVEGFPIQFSSGSTMAGTFIIQSILASAIKILVDKGHTPPVFLSGNMEGGDEHNRKLIDKYRDRIIYYR